MSLLIRAEQKPTSILTAILLMGAFLRVATLGRESLWLDEALSYLIAELPVRDILGNVTADPHPPLYYLILHYWLRLDFEGDMLVRLPDVFWSVLHIAVSYQLGLMFLARKRLAILVAFLAAVAPFQIFYSHELRMYALLMLLSSLCVLAYASARQTDRGRWWLAFFTAALLAIYTHFFSVFVLAAIGIHAVMRSTQRRALLRTVVIGVLLFLLFLPWLVLLLGQVQSNELGSIRPFTQGSGHISTLLIPILTVTVMLFGPSTTSWYVAPALFIGLSLIVLWVIELLKRRRIDGDGALALPILLIVCVIGIPSAVHAIQPFFLTERNMAPAAVFIMVLVAWSMGRQGTALRYLAFASALLMVLGTIFYIGGGAQKPPYRTAMNFIAEQQRPGDAVLHTSDGSYIPALRYTAFRRHGLLEGDPDPRKSRMIYERFGGELWSPEDAGRYGDRLWLIVALEHSEQWQLEQLAYFEAEFQRIAAYDVEGIIVNLYDME